MPQLRIGTSGAALALYLGIHLLACPPLLFVDSQLLYGPTATSCTTFVQFDTHASASSVINPSTTCSATPSVYTAAQYGVAAYDTATDTLYQIQFDKDDQSFVTGSNWKGDVVSTLPLPASYGVAALEWSPSSSTLYAITSSPSIAVIQIQPSNSQISTLASLPSAAAVMYALSAIDIKRLNMYFVTVSANEYSNAQAGNAAIYTLVTMSIGSSPGVTSTVQLSSTADIQALDYSLELQALLSISSSSVVSLLNPLTGAFTTVASWSSHLAPVAINGVQYATSLYQSTTSGNFLYHINSIGGVNTSSVMQTTLSAPIAYSYTSIGTATPMSFISNAIPNIITSALAPSPVSGSGGLITFTGEHFVGSAFEDALQCSVATYQVSGSSTTLLNQSTVAATAVNAGNATCLLPRQLGSNVFSSVALHAFGSSNNYAYSSSPMALEIDECTNGFNGYCDGNATCSYLARGSSCTCNAGYVGNGLVTKAQSGYVPAPNAQGCTPCPSNTYKNETTCAPCPSNRISSPGSAAVTDCVCSPGFLPSSVDIGCYPGIVLISSVPTNASTAVQLNTDQLLFTLSNFVTKGSGVVRVYTFDSSSGNKLNRYVYRVNTSSYVDSVNNVITLHLLPGVLAQPTTTHYIDFEVGSIVGRVSNETLPAIITTVSFVTASAASIDVYDPSAAMELTLTLNMSYALTTDLQRQPFLVELMSELAAVMGISSYRLAVANVASADSGAAVAVQCYIHPAAAGVSEVSPSQAAAFLLSLVSQDRDKSSVLYQQKYLAAIEPSSLVVVPVTGPTPFPLLAVVGVSISAALVIAVLLTLHFKYKEGGGDVIPVAMAFVSVASLVSNIVSLFDMSANPSQVPGQSTLFVVLVISLVGSLSLTVMLAVYVFYTEMDNIKVCTQEAGPVALIWILSCVSLGNIELLSCKIPVFLKVELTTTRMPIYSLITDVVQSIPWFAVQLVFAFRLGAATNATLASLIFSGFSIVFSVAKKVFTHTLGEASSSKQPRSIKDQQEEHKSALGKRSPFEQYNSLPVNAIHIQMATAPGSQFEPTTSG